MAEGSLLAILDPSLFFIGYYFMFPCSVVPFSPYIKLMDTAVRYVLIS